MNVICERSWNAIAASDWIIETDFMKNILILIFSNFQAVDDMLQVPECVEGNVIRIVFFIRIHVEIDLFLSFEQRDSLG